MSQYQSRRRVFALSLCLAFSGLTASGQSQTGATPKGTASPNGVTGTDPCPKNYICTTGGAVPQVPASAGAAPASTSASGSMLQSFLKLLGGK